MIGTRDWVEGGVVVATVGGFALRSALVTVPLRRTLRADAEVAAAQLEHLPGDMQAADLAGRLRGSLAADRRVVQRAVRWLRWSPRFHVERAQLLGEARTHLLTRGQPTAPGADAEAAAQQHLARVQAEADARVAAAEEAHRAEREQLEGRVVALRGDVETEVAGLRAELEAERARNAELTVAAGAAGAEPEGAPRVNGGVVKVNGAAVVPIADAFGAEWCAPETAAPAPRFGGPAPPPFVLPPAFHPALDRFDSPPEEVPVAAEEPAAVGEQEPADVDPAPPTDPEPEPAAVVPAAVNGHTAPEAVEDAEPAAVPPPDYRPRIVPWPRTP